MVRAFKIFGRVISFGLLIVLPAASAQAGLFDFFNPAQPEPEHLTIERPAASEPPIVTAPLPPRRVEIRRHIVIVRKNATDKDIVLAGKSAELQKDDTLREGDAVMTQHGIRIFACASAGVHRANDFAKLEEAKGLTPTEQTALAAIGMAPGDQTKLAGADELVTGRSSATTVVAWKWLRDPKGRLVRYVGP